MNDGVIESEHRAINELKIMKKLLILILLNGVNIAFLSELFPKVLLIFFIKLFPFNIPFLFIRPIT